MDLGELKARLTAEASQIKAEIRTVKKDILELGEQGKKVQSGFSGLNDSLSQLGLSAKQIEKINKELRNTNPDILNKQLAAVREELKKLGIESKQIEKIENELKQTSDEAENTAKSVGSIETGLVALGANVALDKMLGVIGSLANEADTLGRSIRGLSEVSKAMGQDVDATTEAAQRLVDKGFMNIQEASEALKTTLATGYDLEESVNVIMALGDAAAYNREAHYSWGEAVVQAVRGIKQQNSTLTDAAGITTNLSVMYQRYADSIGKSVGTLTEAQKKQAAYNGMMQEAALFAGNAESAMEGYTGSNTMFNQTIAMARAELGEAFLPVLREIMDTLQPIIVDFAKWTSENKEMVAGIAAGTIAITSLIAILTTLITVIAAVRAAMISLNLAMGPIGWIIAAISAIAIGVTSYTLASDAASDSVLQFAKNQDELNKKLKESPLKTSTTELEQMKSDIDTLNELLERRIELESEMKKITDLQKQSLGTSDMMEQLFDLGGAIKEIDGVLKDMDFDSADEATDALERMKDAAERAAPAVLELKRAEISELATKVQQIDQTDRLVDRYKELMKVQSLDETQKNELKSVIKQLKQEYPDLIQVLDDEGKMYIQNEKLIYGQIDANKTMVTENAKLYIEDLDNFIKTYQAKVELLDQNIDAVMGSEGLQHSMNPELHAHLMKQREEANGLREAIQRAKKMSQSISAGTWGDFLPSDSDDPEKKKKEKKRDPQQEEFDAEMKLIRFKTEMYGWSAEQQIEAYEKVQTKHQVFLKRSLDDEHAVILQLKSLRDELEHAKFDNSVKWIEKEKYFKRLSLNDELAAWERVHARYIKGSKEREQAEREIFRIKQELMKAELERIKEAEKVQKDLESEMKEFVSKQKKQVEESRKNELKSIEDAKKAYVSAQDEKIRALDKLIAAEADANSDEDYEEELAKKQARAALLLNAVGPEGKKERKDLLVEIAEMEEAHAEELRKRDLESQKDALQEDKHIQEDAFAEAKSAAESHYDDLIKAIENYQDDAQGVEVAIKNFRVATAKTANESILTDLDAFVADYKSKMSQITSLDAQNEKDRDWMKYQENQAIWNNPGSTMEQKQKANATNISLRDKYGISQTDYANIQHFRSGGIVQGDQIGQTIPVMAEVGEMFLNPSQQAVLFKLLDGVISDVAGQSTSTNTQQIVQHFDLSVAEVHNYDTADVESMYAERENLMKRMQARSGAKIG